MASFTRCSCPDGDLMRYAADGFFGSPTEALNSPSPRPGILRLAIPARFGGFDGLNQPVAGLKDRRRLRHIGDGGFPKVCACSAVACAFARSIHHTSKSTAAVILLQPGGVAHGRLARWHFGLAPVANQP